MYFFDLGDYRPDFTPVGRAITWHEGLLISILFHLACVGLLISFPNLFWSEAAARARALALERQNQQQEEPFVFVSPRVDTPAPKPRPRAEPSDQDRTARSLEQAPSPKNDLPYSRGNSSERVEATAPSPSGGSAPESHSALQFASPDAPAPVPPGSAGTGGGPLGDALRNLGRYVQREQFDNSQGSGAFGPAIQFDTKGVEFGPWIRRFIAQIKRNWNIPYAAMSMRGHVVTTFNVHRDGSITDLMVVGPCPIEGFNNAAYGALASSNPTQPLPPEYPSETAFFTVTFYYNETPP
jgi:outer membrane biosynthesis protein TonB